MALQGTEEDPVSSGSAIKGFLRFQKILKLAQPPFHERQGCSHLKIDHFKSKGIMINQESDILIEFKGLTLHLILVRD